MLVKPTQDMERLIFQTLKENNNLLHVSMYHKRFIFAKLLKNNETLKTLLLVHALNTYIYIYMKRKVDFVTKQDIARYQCTFNLNNGRLNVMDIKTRTSLH